MRALLMAVGLAVLAPATAAAGDAEKLEIIGFDREARMFATWTWGVHDGSGLIHAELNVYSARDGKRIEADSRSLELEQGEADAALERLKADEAARLERLGFGADPGTEMYRSGTPTKTTFTVAGRSIGLRLIRKKVPPAEEGLPAESVRLLLEASGKSKEIFKKIEGWNWSINSVRLAAGEGVLAIVLKHSTRGFEGENRRHAVVVVRL